MSIDSKNTAATVAEMETVGGPEVVSSKSEPTTPAAPGIDLTTAIRNCCEAEKADPDHPDTICISVNDLTVILQQCVIDASPKGDVPRDDLLPGVMRCAKCSFQLHRTNLYLGSGTTGPGDSKTEPCPNGCGPLWPVTWQTWATDGWQQAERYHEELRQLQDSPKGGDERERFETWAKPKWFDVARCEDDNSRYLDKNTRRAWETWEAATQATSAEVGA